MQIMHGRWVGGLFAALIALFVLGPAIAAWAQSGSSDQLASDIRTAILEDGEGFSREQLVPMDVNQDGAIDVADLVALGVIQSVVSFEESESTAAESEGVHVIRLSSNKPLANVPVAFTFGGSATPDQDFGAVSSGTVLMNGTSAEFELPLLDDSEYEGGETVEISLLPTEGYFPGVRPTHTVFLRESAQATQAEYLFNLVRDLPGGAAFTGSIGALLSRTVSVTVTCSGNRVVAARLNERRSIGFADNDENTHVIEASGVSGAGGQLEIEFRFRVDSDSFVSKSSLGRFDFNPDSVRIENMLPAPSEADRVALTQTLRLEIPGFEVVAGNPPEGLLEGTFRVSMEGVLHRQSDRPTSGQLIGSLQPLGVAR